MATLTLPEELEKLEQSITLTLQDCDANFSRAHRIVTTRILPLVERYARQSGEVWEGSRFWKIFFEASANVSLSGYEEAALVDEPHDQADVTHSTLSNDDELNTSSLTDDDVGVVEPEKEDDDANSDDETEIDNEPTAVQKTPKPSATTPTHHAHHSSPFDPASVSPPATRTPFRQPRQETDPVLHRGVLDKNYRIQATPHTQRRHHHQPTPPPKDQPRRDDSPASSPVLAAPQLRSDIFSPAKPPGPRTPGVSLLTPARHSSRPAPSTTIGRPLFGDAGSSTHPPQHSHTRHSVFRDDSSGDDDDDLGMSPPKTMQFHVPASRLVQTPAREASKRIVEDLLLTAGAEDTDEIEGIEADDSFDASELGDASPSVVRRALAVEDDTF